MPLITYREQRFNAQSQKIIDHANIIIAEYAAQGFALTLRQLYYQFVARGLIPNTQLSYKRIGGIVNDARLAGLIDWHAIEDRTRNLREEPNWPDPAAIMRDTVKSYKIDKWIGQDYRPEVWIEKDALLGVIEGVCNELQLPYFSCRGNTSQSEMWIAGQRHNGVLEAGQIPLIIHLGDHDPSGIDMSRDIQDRMDLFTWGKGHEIKRIALNMDQVLFWQPPPNPAKKTDSRYQKYMEKYGEESWELDALEPATLVDLIRETVLDHRDEGLWAAALEEENDGIRKLEKLRDEADEDFDRPPSRDRIIAKERWLKWPE